jgi:hypothetical protein
MYNNQINIATHSYVHYRSLPVAAFTLGLDGAMSYTPAHAN